MNAVFESTENRGFTLGSNPPASTTIWACYRRPQKASQINELRNPLKILDKVGLKWVLCGNM